MIDKAFLRQKSRVKWLKEGDQNTTYFHRMVKGHTAKQRISCLSCDDGSFTTNNERIKSEIIKFYKNHLGTTDPSCSNCDVNYLGDLLPLKLVMDLSVMLTAEVSKEEVFSFNKNMPSNKSLGPGGFIAEFFGAAWEVVGNLVVAVVRVLYGWEAAQEAQHQCYYIST